MFELRAEGWVGMNQVKNQEGECCRGRDVQRPCGGNSEKAARLDCREKGVGRVDLGFGPGPSGSQSFHLQNEAVKLVWQRQLGVMMSPKHLV